MKLVYLRVNFVIGLISSQFGVKRCPKNKYDSRARLGSKNLFRRKFISKNVVITHFVKRRSKKKRVVKVCSKYLSILIKKRHLFCHFSIFFFFHVYWTYFGTWCFLCDQNVNLFIITGVTRQGVALT